MGVGGEEERTSRQHWNMDLETERQEGMGKDREGREGKWVHRGRTRAPRKTRKRDPEIHTIALPGKLL